MNAIVTAQYGLFTAARSFDAAARHVAAGDSDLGAEVVGMAQAKTAYSANAAVIRTASKMQDSLLDILA